MCQLCFASNLSLSSEINYCSRKFTQTQQHMDEWVTDRKGSEHIWVSRGPSNSLYIQDRYVITGRRYIIIKHSPSVPYTNNNLTTINLPEVPVYTDMQFLSPKYKWPSTALRSPIYLFLGSVPSLIRSPFPRCRDCFAVNATCHLVQRALFSVQHVLL